MWKNGRNLTWPDLTFSERRKTDNKVGRWKPIKYLWGAETGFNSVMSIRALNVHVWFVVRLAALCPRNVGTGLISVAAWSQTRKCLNFSSPRPDLRRFAPALFSPCRQPSCSTHSGQVNKFLWPRRWSCLCHAGNYYRRHHRRVCVCAE